MSWRAIAALSLAGFAASHAAAQIIPVSGGGSALQSAVQQAPPGAILELAPGSYLGFAWVLQKDVTIVAPLGAFIVGNLDSHTGGSQFTVRLFGLTLQQSAPGAGGEIWTTGNLVVEQTSCYGLSVYPSATRRLLYMRGCTVTASSYNTIADVDAVLIDSTFRGGFCGAGLGVRGSLRAERTSFLAGGCPYGPTSGLALDGSGTAANCTFQGLASQIYGGSWYDIDNTNGLLVLTAPVLRVRNPVTVRPVATASWSGTHWSLGAATSVTHRYTANAPIAVVIAWDLAPWNSPLAADVLWFNATPNWAVWTLGATNAQGAFAHGLPVPNVPALQYVSTWLTGVCFDPMPLHGSAPLGGLIF